MDEHVASKANVTADEPNIWARHRLGLLLGATMIVAIVLTFVSMTLYNVSGAAQLDLSRPGYQSVSGQVDTEVIIDSYSSSGSVNKQTIQEFLTFYDKQAEKAKAVDAFNGDPLNPELLIPAESKSE